MGPIVIYNHM